MSKLLNLNFKKSNKNPIIECDDSFYELPFYKDTEYFAQLDNFIPFIKSVEKMVRTSKYYSAYIAYIREKVGLNFCQVLSNIKDQEGSITLEMHHGPILTLFDYAVILTDFLLLTGSKVNTFIVSDLLLEEHFNNNVQVVMLSKTVHQEVTDNNIFLNMKHGFGDLNAFLKKYKDALQEEQIYKINKYIELSHKYDSFDKQVLELDKNIKKWCS